MTPASDPIGGEDEEFFVGYLSIPLMFKRRLFIVTMGLVVGIGVMSAVLASKQRSPGEGRWDSDQSISIDAVYIQSPYPMVRVMEPGGSIRTLLLVNEGKLAPAAVKTLAGRRVRVTGTVLQRGNLRLLEIASPMQLLDVNPMKAADPPSAGVEQTVQGEIIDPKCFAGAMKPGDGKTHKGCAALCLRGGIPPVLRVAETNEYYLLVQPGLERCQGETLNALIAAVGEPVLMLGKFRRVNDLTMFEVTGKSVRRR